MCPDARRQEFDLAIQAVRLKRGDVLCDMPAGGGYLQQHLPSELDLQVISVDPSQVFLRKSLNERTETLLSPLHDIPLPSHSCDAVISVAGLHHVEDRGEVFREIRRVLRPGGRLCIFEVAKGSVVDSFLNQFVDSCNSLGHEGEFIDDHFRSALEIAGFVIKRDELLEYTWGFSDEQTMAEFVGLLFGLDRATPDDVLRGVSQYLGYDCSAPFGCKMNWALQAIVCV